MPLDAGQSLSRPGALSSLSGGLLAGAIWDLASHPAVGLPRGQRREAELGAGEGAWVLRCGCRRRCASRIRQRHRQPDAESCRPGSAPVGGMAWQPPPPCGCDGCTVMAGPPPQVRCHGCGQGEHFTRPGHGAGGMWYANHLKGRIRTINWHGIQAAVSGWGQRFLFVLSTTSLEQSQNSFCVCDSQTQICVCVCDRNLFCSQNSVCVPTHMLFVTEL
jgi:hypothetical protein